MRILQINCVYGKGSTGKITKDIHLALLERGIESFVCYGRGAEVSEENVFLVSSELKSKLRRARSFINGRPYAFTRWTNKRLEKQIERIKPDIVHLQCINGYFTDIYRLLDYLKKNKYKTVLTLHAEFMHTGGCGYALECNQWIEGCNSCPRLRSGLGVLFADRVKSNYQNMKKAINGFESLTVVGVSDWISRRAKASAIMSECSVLTIHNGIDTKNVFFKRPVDNLKEKYNIKTDKKIILSVVPDLNSDLKGGRLIMDLARDEFGKDFFFIIVGAREEVEDIPENVLIVPYTENQKELAEFYSLADVFVMGSKMDNYPTVCIEANSCATPVVGFDVGGVSETIFEGMGDTVPYKDVEQLKEKIRIWSEKKQDISEKTAEEVLKRNSSERMIEDYLNVYKSIIENNG